MYPIHSISSRRRRLHKEKERNLLSSVLSMLVVAILSTAIAQPRWFYLRGGACPYTYLGVEQFFTPGDSPNESDIHVGRADTAVPSADSSHTFHSGMDSCVTSHIVLMMRLVIAFCFLAILSSLFAFVLDTFGVTDSTLKMIRRNAYGSTMTVLFCVTVIGLSYYITTQLYEFQSVMRHTELIQVKFDASFYLVVAAGSLAVLATAANLLRKPPSATDDSVENLLDDLESVDNFSIGYPSSVEVSPLHLMPPPPPPYSP